MDKKTGLSGKMDDSEKKPNTHADSPRRPVVRKPAPVSKPEAKKWVPKVIAEHTLTDNETWSHLALRYYGDMSEPYWRYMYEFNKELVGDDYKRIWGGMKIQVPELPDDMKKEKK